jgi:hypothetical protein
MASHSAVGTPTIDQQTVHVEKNGFDRFPEHAFVLSSRPETANDQSRREKLMRIHNLYVDDKGETHFRDIQVEWKHEGRGGKTSDTFPATGIIFRETPGTYDYEWHPAPRRQYIINLDGAVSIQASDGETRIIGAGEVLLVEDTSGKGHFSKAVEGKMRRSIFVPVE